MGPVDDNSDRVGEIRDDSRFDEVRTYWSRVLGTYGPQWMLIVAIEKLDDGNGVAVEALASALNVDRSFVTTHSRLLVSKGFVSITASGAFEDAVRLSLTGKARILLAEFAAQQQRA